MVVLAVVSLCVPVEAGYYLAGEFNGWNAGSDEMTDNGDGTYSLTITGLTDGQRGEFKVTQGNWDWSTPGPNSWYYADVLGEVTVTFTPTPVADGWSPTENRIAVSTDNGNWSVAGDFNGWNNSDAASVMNDIGGGVYMLSLNLSAGDYYFKPVYFGTWDSLSADGRSENTGNMHVITAIGQETVNIYLDELNGAVKVDVVPEPATMGLLALGGLLLRRRK